MSRKKSGSSWGSSITVSCLQLEEEWSGKLMASALMCMLYQSVVVKSRAEAVDLLVDLCSYPSLWPWALGSDPKEVIAHFRCFYQQSANSVPLEVGWRDSTFERGSRQAVWAFDYDTSWTALSWGDSSISNWEETQCNPKRLRFSPGCLPWHHWLDCCIKSLINGNGWMERYPTG